MPTTGELEKEDAYRGQFIPRGLHDLRNDVIHAFKLNRDYVGIWGDNRHLKGYHRSRRWILESEHCTNRSYSVTETLGNRTGGDSNWICGMDIGGSEAQSRMIHTRLRNAMDDGRAPQIRQAILESSPWHVHISFDRAHANDNHASLLRIITGTIPAEVPMASISVTLPVLKNGSQGLDVTTAQGLLVARGHTVKLDGDFGPVTERATRAMQKAYGAEHVDGIWGPETWTIAITRKDTR